MSIDARRRPSCAERRGRPVHAVTVPVPLALLGFSVHRDSDQLIEGDAYTPNAGEMTQSLAVELLLVLLSGLHDLGSGHE